MKKTMLLLLIPLVLGISACSDDQNTSAINTSSQEISSSSLETSEDDNPSEDLTIKAKVYYYISATSAEKSQAFMVKEVPLGSLLPKPDKDPISIDPAFNVFLGWSTKSIAMCAEDYWNFEKDHLPEYVPGGEFILYGQWDYID